MKQNVQVVTSVMPKALRVGIVSNGFSCPKTNKVGKYQVDVSGLLRLVQITEVLKL